MGVPRSADALLACNDLEGVDWWYGVQGCLLRVGLEEVEGVKTRFGVPPGFSPDNKYFNIYYLWK